MIQKKHMSNFFFFFSICSTICSTSLIKKFAKTKKSVNTYFRYQKKKFKTKKKLKSRKIWNHTKKWTPLNAFFSRVGIGQKTIFLIWI